MKVYARNDRHCIQQDPLLLKMLIVIKYMVGHFPVIHLQHQYHSNNGNYKHRLAILDEILLENWDLLLICFFLLTSPRGGGGN